jgi:phospholipase C
MFRRVAFGAALLLAGTSVGSTPTTAAQLCDVEHIIVIYLENHSFDNLFGFFPNADGLAAAGATKIQVRPDGLPYDFLPPIHEGKGDSPIDPRFPEQLPNQPFSIDAYVPIGEPTRDLIHRFFYQKAQIDGGLMDKFAAYSDAGGLAMGFYDGSRTKLWDYARRYTLADHFFHAAFGGSFLNHFWMVCACTPRYEDAPSGPNGLKADPDEAFDNKLDLVAQLKKPDKVTNDGYAVNTLQPFDPPHLNEPTLPLQDMTTIGDELSDKGIDWAWYAGGWDDAIANHPDKNFQTHHQPFAYFKKYAANTEGRSRHLKDARDFVWQVVNGTLPPVAFYKPIGELNEHPGYANVLEGDEHLGQVLHLIEQSPIWSNTVVIVTFDENGGYWDHVPPPVVDRWGPGLRVPTVIISPFAKKGFIDHTVYDTTAILKLIETRFGLDPLGERDKNSKDLTAAFDFMPHQAERICKP